MTSPEAWLALAFEIPRAAYEVAFGAYALVVTALVVLERRRPTATLALVLALVFVPVLGLLAYLVFSRRVQRRVRRRARRPIKPVDDTRGVANLEQIPEDLPRPARGLVRLALHSGAAPLRRSETVTLLPTTPATFEAFADAIASATRTIHCEFYIWRDDATGRRITALLAERARQGVTVRVLYDHLGSWGLPHHHFEALREAGGKVGVFGRMWLPLMLVRRRVNFRNHRKILTVDGQRGFLGGVNVGDEYLDPDGDDARWRDLAVELRGDAVVGLEAIFLEDWLASTGEVVDLEGARAPITARFDARRPLPGDHPWQRKRAARARECAEAINPFTPPPVVPARSLGPLVQVVASGPDMPLVSAIAAQFSAAIASATHRVWLATPYFVPDESLMFSLCTAAMRGVDLRVMVPALRHNDVRLVAWAARSYYDELLAAGGRLYEYELGMLHSKYLIADDICAIGSANMDVRSFFINYEVTGMFYDSAFTTKLERVFEEDLGHAREIREEDRVNPSLLARMAENTARVLSPLL